MNSQILTALGLSGDVLVVLILVLLALSIASMVIAIVAVRKYKGLEKKYIRFMGGSSATALEEQLAMVLDMQQENRELIESNYNNIRVLRSRLMRCFQKMGLVKYDAFQEMGGKLSYALALLNEKNDGFIINTVHHPESSYSYIKSIHGGKTNIELSEEEINALQKALGTVDK